MRDMHHSHWCKRSAEVSPQRNPTTSSWYPTFARRTGRSASVSEPIPEHFDPMAASGFQAPVGDSSATSSRVASPAQQIGLSGRVIRARLPRAGQLVDPAEKSSESFQTPVKSARRALKRQPSLSQTQRDQVSAAALLAGLKGCQEAQKLYRDTERHYMNLASHSRGPSSMGSASASGWRASEEERRAGYANTDSRAGSQQRVETGKEESGVHFSITQAAERSNARHGTSFSRPRLRRNNDDCFLSEAPSESCEAGGAASGGSPQHEAGSVAESEYLGQRLGHNTRGELPLSPYTGVVGNLEDTGQRVQQGLMSRTNKRRWAWKEACAMLRVGVLFLFIVLLIAAAAAELWYGDKSPALLTLGFAFVVYFLTLLVMWLGLALAASRGRTLLRCGTTLRNICQGRSDALSAGVTFEGSPRVSSPWISFLKRMKPDRRTPSKETNDDRRRERLSSRPPVTLSSAEGLLKSTKGASWAWLKKLRGLVYARLMGSRSCGNTDVEKDSQVVDRAVSTFSAEAPSSPFQCQVVPFASCPNVTYAPRNQRQQQHYGLSALDTHHPPYFMLSGIAARQRNNYYRNAATCSPIFFADGQRWYGTDKQWYGSPLWDYGSPSGTAHYGGSTRQYFCSPWKALRFVRWRTLPSQAAILLSNFPAFQISLIARNVGWCGLYIWATTLITRPTASDAWDTSHIPATFWIVEGTFMWMITWDYIVALLAAPDAFRWVDDSRLGHLARNRVKVFVFVLDMLLAVFVRFVLTFPSIIDLLTMPTAKAVAALLVSASSINYSLYFGSLRVLRLIRLEGILFQVIPWISQVKLRLISLAVGAVVITLMFASAMFILEAPYGQRTGFVSLYDFFFFAVVTISTVGYGDFAPTKPASKAIVIVAIVVALTVLPTQIQKLLSAVQTPLTVVGRLPSDKQDYIVISGPIDPQQLALICRELALAFPGCCSRVLVITPDAVVDYVDAIRDAFLRDAMRISAIRLDFVSLKARTYYRNARAVFIVGNMRPKESNALQKFSLKDSEATLLEEDHNALLRFIGAQHVCWPARPICIQLSDGATTRLVTEMGAYHVLCVQHIKMKLLGKACSGCPGFSTLMTNLFYTPPKEADLLVNNLHTGRLKVSDETRNLRLYYRGARYQLYRLEFPQCCIGNAMVLKEGCLKGSDDGTRLSAMTTNSLFDTSATTLDERLQLLCRSTMRSCGQSPPIRFL